MCNIVFLAGIICQAQGQTYNIQGQVLDKEGGSPLVNALVMLLPKYEQPIVTDSAGQFAFKAENGQYRLKVTAKGFQPYVKKITVENDTFIRVYLSKDAILEPVTITAESSKPVHKDVQMSKQRLQVDKVESLPVILGETDVIKTIQLLPGIQSGVEGLTGLYVRGGGADQNLILMDDVPLYNINHMLGIFSVFNPGVVGSADIIKGGFPAQYGGRLSSVLDVKTKEGSYDSLQGEGSVGIMLSRLTLRMPLIKGRTALTLSARRSYYDLLVRPVLAIYTASQNVEKVNTGYYFYDVNARLDHKISDHQHLTISSFFARDRFYLRYSSEYLQTEERYKAQVGWGNFFVNTHYRHQINDQLVNKSSVAFSRYRFFAGVTMDYEQYNANTGNTQSESQSINFYSLINDITAKSAFTWQPNALHQLDFGIHNIFHIFSPGASVADFLLEDDISMSYNGFDTLLNAPNINANELSLYAQDEWQVNKRLKMQLGLHLNLFTQRDYTAISLQPRFSARYLTSAKTSLKVSYAKMQQNIHLLTNATIGLPTDLWVPATKNAPSEISHQVAMGFAAKLPRNVEFSVEGYYKTMENVIEYGEGKIFIGGDENWEEVIEIGDGTAYGVEFFLEKRVGKFSGWIGYTLAWSNRLFSNLNRGRPFPYKYDRRHDVNVALNYKFNEKLDLGVVWVYGTGYAYTLSNGFYHGFEYLNSDGIGRPIEGSIRYNQNRNNFRSPTYHRLDIGLNWHKKLRWGERTWRFGVYNAYNQMNPFMIYWEDQLDFYREARPTQKLHVLTLLPIMPSASWAFKF